MIRRWLKIYKLISDLEFERRCKQQLVINSPASYKRSKSEINGNQDVRERHLEFGCLDNFFFNFNMIRSRWVE